MMCRTWARQALFERNPQAKMLDPVIGICCDGRRRTAHQAEYDFLLEGRRVSQKLQNGSELKSSTLDCSMSAG